MNKKDIMGLIEQKIRDRLDTALKHKPINRSNNYRNTRWKIYDNLIEIGKNIDLIYLELLYSIVEDILDSSILFEDWDRLDRFSKEKKSEPKSIP